MVVRVDGATHLLWLVDFWATRECPPGAEALRPKTRAAVRLWALAAGWLSSKAWTICYERAKASESPRVAKSACERLFWSKVASNSPKTNDFGAKRSVSRRPITVAVFRRAVRHHRAPARRSTPSPTPTRCPTLAESVSAEKQRMVSAALCGRVRASVEVCATCPSIDGPNRSRGRLDRERERPGAPPGAQNSSFSPKSTPIWLSRVSLRRILLCRACARHGRLSDELGRSAVAGYTAYKSKFR